MSSKKKKTAKKRAKKARGARYTPKQKAEVVAFVHNYNKKNGRGGQSQAVKKFGITAVTIMSWLKAPEVGSKVVTGSHKAKVAQLNKVGAQLHKLDEQSAKLKRQYDQILASILGEI